MACTHTAAMSVLARFGSGGGSQGRVVPLANAAARLLRAYSIQVETLRRLRHGGDQYVRVEHVHVGDGGQAIVGNVKTHEPLEGSPRSLVTGRGASLDDLIGAQHDRWGYGKAERLRGLEVHGHL